MPFQYVRDDTGRRVQLTLSDPVTVKEMLEMVDLQLADGAWKYGTLVDVRGLSSAASSAELRAFMDHFRELVAVNGDRGPLVIVARGSGTIGNAHMYESMGGTAKRAFELFWDMDDARQWLHQQLQS